MADEQELHLNPKQFPPGFKLLYSLLGHKGSINEIAWSPDGRTLASASDDRTVRLWDALNGKLLQTIEGLKNRAIVVNWSPDGRMLASASGKTIWLWDVQNNKLFLTFKGHEGVINSVAWSPDGTRLASGSDDATIRIWNYLQSGNSYQTLIGHQEYVYSISWAPDGRRLASASQDKNIFIWDSEEAQVLRVLKAHNIPATYLAWGPTGILASGFDDGTICIWDAESGQQLSLLEGHTSFVNKVRFSPDGLLLASYADDERVRLWRCDNWESVAVLNTKFGNYITINLLREFAPNFGGLSFHPYASILATRGTESSKSNFADDNFNLDSYDDVIHIWQLDYNLLLSASPQLGTRYYKNAKVVLLGDSGVGKSGLGLVLTGREFMPTESTHGRNVWMFDTREVKLPNNREETRETLLWDLAGQPGYRLIHQLHLNEVAVALVVFDARSETEPFAGVRHWDRALRQAQRLQGDSVVPLKKYLVAARADRGGVPVSKQRIEATVRELGFDGYFETSAKESWQIKKLIEAIHESINWEVLPRVSSNKLFQTIKQFLIDEKKAGRLLSTADDLYRSFCQAHAGLTSDNDLRAKFDTCVGRVENRGLIRRLSFGDYVLMQTELLDAYASAIVNSAQSEPDGLGFIPEEDALNGRLKMSEDERVTDKKQENLLLIATVEELLRHEIALKEVTESGSDLVFPSQFTRERPDAPEMPGKAVVFNFEGPLLTVYATLAVRLAHSQLFKKKEMWKNAATFTAKLGGTCGIYLRELNEGQGDLTLFFEKETGEATRRQFEEYVTAHLQRRALPQTIKRRRILICHECGEPVTESQAKRRLERDFNFINCSVCDTSISLLDREEGLMSPTSSAIVRMDRAADAKRDLDTAATILKGKIATDAFDVFLSYNSKDREAVKTIGERLKEHGILPWMDISDLRPGMPWQKDLEKRIKTIKSAAVFVGKEGIGPWQDLEQEAFLRQFVKRKCPVIPVILLGCGKIPKLPVFLEGMTWVDFRKKEPNPMEQLIWGITGERSHLR